MPPPGADASQQLRASGSRGLSRRPRGGVALGLGAAAGRRVERAERQVGVDVARVALDRVAEVAAPPARGRPSATTIWPAVAAGSVERVERRRRGRAGRAPRRRWPGSSLNRSTRALGRAVRQQRRGTNATSSAAPASDRGGGARRGGARAVARAPRARVDGRPRRQAGGHAEHRERDAAERRAAPRTSRPRRGRAKYANAVSRRPRPRPARPAAPAASPAARRRAREPIAPSSSSAPIEPGLRQRPQRPRCAGSAAPRRSSRSRR